MIFREVRIEDLEGLKYVRNNVVENTLSNPLLISDKDYIEFIESRGKGWICEMDNKIVGFAMVDLRENNVLALLVLPVYEKRGIDLRLHNIMLSRYFYQTKNCLWLSTSPNTRAEKLYRKFGWKEKGKHGIEEIKFEMTFENWKEIILS